MRRIAGECVFVDCDVWQKLAWAKPDWAQFARDQAVGPWHPWRVGKAVMTQISGLSHLQEFCTFRTFALQGFDAQG
jgi:hypothetical protein